MKSLCRFSWNTIVPALLLAGILILSPGASWAEVPSNMNMQGRLTDPSGDPVATGLKIFTFKIFDAEVGGTEIWPDGAGENQTLSTDANGLWNARVGELIPLGATVFADTSRWLEVTVDDGINPAETLSRIKLNTNPWACQAVAATSADNATTADQAADASMLDGRPSSDYARSIHLHAPADINPQGPTSGLDADLLDGSELSDIQAEIDVDVAAHASSNDHDTRYYSHSQADSRFVNTSGDNMSGILGTPQVNLGNVGQSGRLELYQNGTSSAILIAAPYGTDGAFLNLLDETGTPTIELTPDGNGQGGYMALHAPTGYVEIDGNYAALGDPRVTITGSSSTTLFDTRQTGTSSVQLPGNAIDSSEIVDEPGIASANTSGSVTFTGTMQDIETVSITTPAGGYIVVEGDCIGRESGTVGKAQGWIQIDETSGGTATPPHALFFGLASHATTAGYNAFPVHVSRVYLKGSAGTYTFRMEGILVNSNDPGANVSAAAATLTATYYPTSYGSVATMVSAAEAGEFPSATPVTIEADPSDPAASASGEVLYQVDLRDLELKLARANAEAERARRELLEARLNSEQALQPGNQER